MYTNFTVGISSTTSVCETTQYDNWSCLIDHKYFEYVSVNARVDIMVVTRTGIGQIGKSLIITCTKKANIISRSFAGGVPESCVHIDM